MSKGKFTDGENTATVCVHHSVNKLCVCFLHTEMYNKIKAEVWMYNKQIYISHYDLEAIKQVLNAITTTTNRWRSVSLEVTDSGLCVHEFKIIVHEIRHCGWKNCGYRNFVFGKTEHVSSAFCVLVLHFFEGF